MLARLESQSAELRKARLLAEGAQERLQRAAQLAPDDPTLNSLVNFPGGYASASTSSGKHAFATCYT